MINFKTLEPYLNSFNSGIIILDEELIVHYWNHWLEIQTHIKHTYICGQPINTHFPEIPIETLKRQIKTALTLDAPTFYNAASSHYLFEIPIENFGNTHFEFMQQNISIVPLHENYAILFITDQTHNLDTNFHLRRILDEIKELNASLEHEKSIIDAYVPMIKVKDNCIISFSSAIGYFNLDPHLNCVTMEDAFHLDPERKLHDNSDIYILDDFYSQGEEIFYRIVSQECTPNQETIYILENVTSQILLEEKQSQLLHQSQHAAMGEMISMIAHQWRQPLAVISSLLAQTHLENGLDTFEQSKVMQRVDKIDETVNFLSQTITDFSNFFKPDKKKKILDIMDLVEQSLFFIVPLLKGSDVELLNMCELHCTLELYENEMTQVLVNILKNAMDEFERKKVDGAFIAIATAKDEKYATISIKDNAGGIPDDIIKKIFQPYFSTKAHNGTGLGLYMSKTIIEEHHDGKLFVETKNDTTTFTIALPLLNN